MSTFGDFSEFLNMDPEERAEKIDGLLADVAEPWLDDPAEGLVLGMVQATRGLLESAAEYAKQVQSDDEEVSAKARKANQYVLGVFANTYAQGLRNFQALVGLSDMKRKFS
jgi:hypothetical protein